MSARRAVWEVARRELVERSRSRVMRISVVVVLILSIGGAVAAARLSDQTPTDHVGLVGPRSVALEPAIRARAAALDRKLQARRLATAAAAAKAVRDGSIDVAVIDGERLLVKSSRTQPAVRVVQETVAAQATVDRLQQLGLTLPQASRALAPTPLPVLTLDPNARKLERNRTLVMVGLTGLLMVLVFFGQAVAQGVTEEKASRVVELLLTTVSPRRLLAGKVLGIGLLGLAQLLLAGTAALVAGRLAGGVGLPAAAPQTVGLVLLWFVLGYAFYSVAFAATGALVSRQEDLQTAMTPVTFVLLGGFYLGLILGNSSPNGTFAQIAAFLPPFAPMVVPARVVLGDMTAAGLALAVLVDLLATAGLIVVAARIYERSILRIGAPVRLSRTLLGGKRMRKSLSADLILRVAAIGLLLGGVAIGLHEPIAIVLLVLGLLLIALAEARKRGPRRPVP